MQYFPSFRQSAHQGPEFSLRSYISPTMKRSNDDNTAFASPYDSPHISSATGTDGAEAKNQARTKQLDWIRIGLATLTLAVSVAVVGCTGDTIHAYYWTQPGPQWHLRLIPARLDLRPTTALLASSSLIAFTSLAYIVVAMLSIVGALFSLL